QRQEKQRKARNGGQIAAGRLVIHSRYYTVIWITKRRFTDRKKHSYVFQFWLFCFYHKRHKFFFPEN
ncbi:MAG: hypothetical protein LBC09_01690, partial [Helicobacteraceae bacterium]|nr:hypothetical protein [Helicobacteraceae bacterium]